MKKEQKKQILDRIMADQCPYCGSDNTFEGDTENGRSEMRQVMFCEDCDLHWTDFYLFKKVVLTDMPDGEKFIVKQNRIGRWGFYK